MRYLIAALAAATFALLVHNIVLLQKNQGLKNIIRSTYMHSDTTIIRTNTVIKDTTVYQHTVVDTILQVVIVKHDSDVVKYDTTIVDVVRTNEIVEFLPVTSYQSEYVDSNITAVITSRAKGKILDNRFTYTLTIPTRYVDRFTRDTVKIVTSINRPSTTQGWYAGPQIGYNIHGFDYGVRLERVKESYSTGLGLTRQGVSFNVNAKIK